MFITIDGPDGAGKTSVANQLIETINHDAGQELAVYTAEPTRSALGMEIRRILQHGTPSELQKLTGYFIEDRQRHVEEITGLVRRGHIVICDRYKYSTVVYQHQQGEDLAKLIQLNRSFLSPDYAFILNVDQAGILLSHIAARNNIAEFFETSPVLEQAIILYGQMKTFFPDDNLIFIDAKQSVEKTTAEIRELIWPEKNLPV